MTLSPEHPWSAKLTAALTERKTTDLYRARRLRQGPQQPRQKVEGREMVSFCSNDYLGLAAHPAVRAAMIQAIEQTGAGSGASHLVNGHGAAHHQLEQALARFCGRPRALLFASGYQANTSVIAALADRHCELFLDKLNHASLIDGAQLARARWSRYPHNDWQALAKKLRQSNAPRKLIITDGVFSMDGDVAPLSELARLAREHQAWLMVDDAHGMGVLGTTGRGSGEGMDHEAIPVLVGTLGKAFGVSGAWVAGSETLIEYLIQTARGAIYTTATPPAVAAGALAALRVAEAEPWRRENVLERARYFHREASALGLPLLPSATPIQGVVLGDAHRAMAASQALWERGFWVTAIRPPTVPVGSARLRITFSASHQWTEVDALLAVLADWHRGESGNN